MTDSLAPAMTSSLKPAMTAIEVAPLLRTDRWQVTRWCREGKLRATKPGRTWLIDEDAVVEFKAAHSNVPPIPDKPARRRRTRA